MLIAIFTILALIISAIFHEYAHGYVAYKLGDSTAKDAGRLTLNPIAHIDPIGSVLLPLLLVLSGSSFIVGWAKPVPYNPYNLRDPKYGDLKVALGGPGTNLFLAAFFGILARLVPLAYDYKQSLAMAFFSGNNSLLMSQLQGSFLTSIFVLSIIVCFINLLLMIFNLIPLPPLDGSKIILPFLPYNAQMRFHQLEGYGMIIIFLLLYLGLFSLLSPILTFLFSLFVGI